MAIYICEWSVCSPLLPGMGPDTCVDGWFYDLLVASLFRRRDLDPPPARPLRRGRDGHQSGSESVPVVPAVASHLRIPDRSRALCQREPATVGGCERVLILSATKTAIAGTKEPVV